MKYVGIDLHKKTISGCVVVKERGKRKIAARKRLECRDEAGIKSWFSELGKFEVVVEATASYKWFVKLVEPLACRVVLAHPKKLRIIAESKRKSDKLDAQILAEFLASDEIPLAYRPCPRVREHRALVRWRGYIQRRLTSVKNKLRHILAAYNADVPNVSLHRDDRQITPWVIGYLGTADGNIAGAKVLIRVPLIGGPLGGWSFDINRRVGVFAGNLDPSDREKIIPWTDGEWRTYVITPVLVLRQGQRFIDYSGKELAQKIGLKTGKKRAAGLVREIRNRISKALLQHATLSAAKTMSSSAMGPATGLPKT
jgi:hypothetical protein